MLYNQWLTITLQNFVKTGLFTLGQFYHGIQYEVTDLCPGETPEKPDATMYVKGQKLRVTRYLKHFHLVLLV